MRLLRHFFLPLLLLAAPAQLSGQALRGRVMATGQPLAEAVVAVWGAHAELTRGLTGPSGDFVLPLGPTDTAYTLAVRAIGYQPLWIPLASVDTSRLVITMTPFALALPDLAAEAATRRCPIDDNPATHQLWEALATRYAVPPPHLGMAMRVRQWTATVGVREVGELRESQLYPALQGLSGRLRAAAARAIDSSGYGRQLRPPYDQLLAYAAGSELYFQWWYPSLDTWDFEQWLAPAFGRRHALAQVTLPSGAMELVFCPRDTRQPALAGLMHLGADSALESVTWEVRTPKPQERAGGRIDFGALRGPSPQLQPIRSASWRLLGGSKDRYLQRVTVFSELVIGETDTIPRVGPRE